MDRVRSMGTEAVLPHQTPLPLCPTLSGRGESRILQVPPRRGQRRLHPFAIRSDQFQEERPLAARTVKEVSEILRLGDLADRRRAVADALGQPLHDGRDAAQACRAAALHHASQPIGHADARPPDRTGQVAEFQVRMGVHQARNQGHVAEILDRHTVRRTAHRHDPARGDCHCGVLYRRAAPRERPIGHANSQRGRSTCHQVYMFSSLFRGFAPLRWNHQPTKTSLFSFVKSFISMACSGKREPEDLNDSAGWIPTQRREDAKAQKKEWIG